MKIFAILIIAVCLLRNGSGFYIYIRNSSNQCFFSNIFKDEQLLIEVETPIISLKHKIQITVKIGE